MLDEAAPLADMGARAVELLREVYDDPAQARCWPWQERAGLLLAKGESPRGERKPPRDFWREIPCGHPPDPLAFWTGTTWVCHCGWGALGDQSDLNADRKDAPFPLVSCQKCGCLVGLKPSDGGGAA